MLNACTSCHFLSKNAVCLCVQYPGKQLKMLILDLYDKDPFNVHDVNVKI